MPSIWPSRGCPQTQRQGSRGDVTLNLLFVCRAEFGCQNFGATSLWPGDTGTILSRLVSLRSPTTRPSETPERKGANLRCLYRQKLTFVDNPTEKSIAIFALGC